MSKIELEVDTAAPVLVTGATGYVAGWLVKRLLEAGLRVHATVRDPSNEEKVAHLKKLAGSTPGTLQLFRADLLEMGSFAEAMKSCRVVFHTASPFKTHVADPQTELVEPAQLGTRNVLEEAIREESVQRVVLTSSVAAIYGDNADLERTPRGTFTEDVWNTSSSLAHAPYSYSKTVAEREAWTLAEQQSNWRLVVINPSLVMGPGIDPRGTSESFTLIRQLGDGTMKGGVPDFGIGVVDVRDVAEAHFRAGFSPRAAGRHIVSAHDTSFVEMARLLARHYGDRYPIPTRQMPKWLVWLLGPLVNDALTRRYVSRNVGYPFVADNSKSKELLGMEYRSLEESLTDFFEQMIESGQLHKS